MEGRMPTAADTRTPENSRTVEEHVPFSSSILWSWMKQYYTEGGVAVWTGGDIPFHITNTPLLATEWATTIFTLLRDFHRQGLLDPSAPIQVYELGPGTGRHAFFLLRELEKLEKQSKVLAREGLKFVLELSELGIKGLQSLSEHPQLRPYLESGRLRLSQFDIAEDGAPKAWPASGEERIPSPNPVFVVANYVLDSLPYDVVRCRGRARALAYCTVQVQGLAPGQDPRSLADLGEKIDLSFEFTEEEVTFPYASWDHVLSRYDDLADTHLPFPTAAMSFMERLRGWSQSGAVLLAADKSFVSRAQLQGLEVPELVPHGGGFSFNANVHTMGYLAEGWGGRAWHTSARDGTLDLSHLVLPAVDQTFRGSFLEMETRFEQLELFHAVDRFRLKESVDEAVPRPKFRLALDLLRLSGLDPQVFYEVSDHLLNGLDFEEVEPEAQTELMSVLERCLEDIFPVGDEVDMAFEVGRIAYRLEDYALSERAFLQSISTFGEDPKTRFNLGLGWYYQKRWSEAEQAFERALELDGDYIDAQEWLEKTRRRAKAEAEPEEFPSGGRL